MAEGFAKTLRKDLFNAYSAGVNVKGVDPIAIKVMSEVGIDIANYHSKNVTELKDIKFDYVVTVCANANENCPVFPGKTKIIHFGFDDPPHLAKSAKNEEEVLSHYRKVRDEIKNFVENMSMTTELNNYY